MTFNNGDLQIANAVLAENFSMTLTVGYANEGEKWA